MIKFSDKVRRLKYKVKHDFLSVENVVLVIAIVMCLSWTYRSVEAMSRNWELNERLSAEKKSLELATVEVEAAELENEYYASAEYQELAARKYANKQLTGENMVYLEENSEAAKNKHKTAEVEDVLPAQVSNYEKWMRFLFP